MVPTASSLTSADTPSTPPRLSNEAAERRIRRRLLRYLIETHRRREASRVRGLGHSQASLGR